MILIFLFFVSLLLFYNFYWKRRHLPPGPVPLPFLGNVLSFRRPPPSYFIEWRKKYGDIYTFWLSERPIVCLNNVQTIMDTFVKDGETYAGRPDFKEFLELAKNGVTGIILTDGEVWRDHRRFALHVLRDFGLGKNLMQEKILDEITRMVDDVKAGIKTGETTQSMVNHLDVAVGSIINSLLFGFTFRGGAKEEYMKQKRMLSAMVKLFAHPISLIFQFKAHIFRFVPGFSNVYNRIGKHRDEVFRYFEQNIARRKREMDFDVDVEPIDYVDAYLRKQHDMEKRGEPHNFTDEHLYGCLWDLYLAGQETTSNTLAWAVLYLVKHPEIQQKIHAELDAQIASDRVITVNDKPKLHYLNAFVAETQRHCNLVNPNVIHRTLKDVELHGYKLPKGTCITHHINCVLYDEQLFPEPLRFRPERFIDAKGTCQVPAAVMPFGVGKRACLGESLARMELCLFTANLCNQFEFAENPNFPISERREPGGTVPPQPFHCDVKIRT